ncbi:hypothetical protein H8356DRAFT_1423659 [Neocallimastix lanati (nom. inval.)]|nr:hypothetical protein H8356DRAFT_1423659 [Neocallimastix sp. JGI-2020a]
MNPVPEYFFARTNENKKAIEYFRKVNILINNMDNDMDSINNWIENKDEENKEENKDEENNKSIEGNKISCPVGYAIKIHDIFLEEELVIKKLKNKCESQLVTDIKNLCENKHYFYMEVSYQYVEDKMLSKSLNCRCDILCLNIPLVNLYNMLIFMDTPFFVDNKIIDYNRQVYTIKNYTSLKLCYSWANGDSTLVNPNIKLDNEIHLVISDDIIELNANIYLSLVEHSAVLHTLIEQNEEKHYVIDECDGKLKKEKKLNLKRNDILREILIYPSNIVLQSTKNIAVLRTDYRRRMSQTYSTILIEGRHIYERNAILEISIVKWILRIMKDGGSIDCGITPFVKGMLVMPTYYRSGDCSKTPHITFKYYRLSRKADYDWKGIHRLRWYNITLQEEGFHHINDVLGTSSISVLRGVKDAKELTMCEEYSDLKLKLIEKRILKEMFKAMEDTVSNIGELKKVKIIFFNEINNKVTFKLYAGDSKLIEEYLNQYLVHNGTQNNEDETSINLI